MEKMLALFATALLLSATVSATETPTPVYDIEGDEVRSGHNYYIVSAIWGAGGGGLTLRPEFGTICPLYVAQEPSDLMYGLPLRLHPVNTSNTVIYTSTDLNMQFMAPNHCRQPTVWKLYQGEEGFRIGIGGDLGDPGEHTVGNWFKIEPAGFMGAYKMRYCPSVVKGLTVPCGDVGLVHGRFLGLTDDRPFPPWLFLKADTVTKRSAMKIYGGIRKVI